jgi:ESCRT-II complex subunit VPS25
MSSFAFSPPEFWNFPPFFTLQPVESTRVKQLALWKDLILKYHMERNIHTMTLAEFQYFENKSIDRRMNPSGITAIIEYLIASGTFHYLRTIIQFVG